MPTERVLPSVRLTGGDVATSALLADGTVDALAVPVAPAAAGDDHLTPGEGTAAAAARYGIDLAELAERAGLTGAAGEAHVVQLPLPVGSAVELPWQGLPPRLVLVGTGTGSARDLTRAGAALARAARGLHAVACTVGTRPGDPASTAAQAVRAVAEGYLLGAYPPLRVPGTAAPTPVQPSADLVLLGRDGTRAATAVQAARAVAQAVWLARDLTATPSSTKDPQWLAEQAVGAARDAGLQVEVLGPKELAADGFGGLLAVGGGSARPARLVRVTSRPEAGDGRHVVVVGKGITFDTGGISLKQREAMVAMKTDMAGAAVALATVLGAAVLGCPHTVTAVLPLAENHLGAGSYRPGDVVRVHGGRSVEVTNTDAEGRLVLADALDWAATTLAPDLLIDVATLTSAVTVALGRTHAGLYTDDDALAAALSAAGERAGETVWRLPLVADYERLLDSSVADVRQVANDPGAGAGSIVAALLLRRFTHGVRWAHLDVAGTARAAAAAHEVPEGATGYGVRLLLALLTDPSFRP